MAAGHFSGRDGGDDPASSQHHCNKRNKDQKCHREDMVAAANRTARPQPTGMPRALSNSRGHSKPTARSTGGKQSTFSRTVPPSGLHLQHPRPAGQGPKVAPKASEPMDTASEANTEFPEADRYLMIFEGS
jgi:hypothetical protein